MKRTFLKRAAVSAVTASVVMIAAVMPASALLEKVEKSGDSLTQTTTSIWKVLLNTDYNDRADGAQKLDFIVHISGDTNKYDKEKEQGFYDLPEDAPEDKEPDPFIDFSGNIGIMSGSDFLNFEYTSLDKSEAGDLTVGVTELGDHKYLLTADLSSKDIKGSEYGTTMQISEDTSSTDYYLTVDEVNLYGKDGNIVVHFDSVGNADYQYETPDAPAPEETAAQTESAADNNSGGNNDSSDNSTPAQTAAAAAASGTAPTTQNTDFGSRDSTLVIVGIAAGVLIVVVVVVLVLYTMKKKR